MLPPKQQPPDALKSLFDGTGPRAREFRENIRQYNATLVFTSLGVDIVGADVASYKVYIIIKLESFSAITTSSFFTSLYCYAQQWICCYLWDYIL